MAVGASDTTIEQVLARGEAGSSSAAASVWTAAHKRQDPANDISYLGFDYEEEVMSEKKWKRVESIDCLKRKIEAKKQELGAVDVAEVFSPPRFTRGASHLGLNAGFAVDLETGWDLDVPDHMRQLKEWIEVQDPFMLTGSPRCDPFSVLQNLNKYYLDNAKNREALERGERHLCLSIDLYEERWKKGKYFLHERPVGAKSWDHPRMVKLQKRAGVFTVVGPMCAWGMGLEVPKQGRGLVYKATKFVTNSKEVAKLLDRCCTNRTGGPLHRHISLIGGLAHLCAKYPDELVYTVLQGIKNQMMVDGCLNSIQAYSSGPDPTEPLFPEEFQEEVEQFYDDISGEQLPSKLVQEARAEEIGWIHKIGLYDKVPRSQAAASGKPILPVRWVDVNKGDKAHYKVRSRIVGKELKAKTKEALLAHELFSATPPWEMVKALFSLLVTDFEKQDKELVMGVFDISRAHFMPKVLRELYVEIPEEDKKPEEGDIVGRLNRGMYGFRDASHAWMLDWQELLRGGGYRVGAANPALFYNAEECSRGAVHGDDFYVLGPVEAVDKVKELLGSKYQMRESHRLGFTTGCVQEATVLNRVVRLGTTDGRRWVRIEPDKRHVELIVQGVGLSMKSAGVSTPSIKPTDAQAGALETSAELSPKDASRYRSGVMRASFLSQERADIAEAVKRLAQGMAKPRLAHWEMLKRLARYLIQFPNISLVYHQQKMPDYIRISVDSDFAGDKVGRRSTTGMVQFFGRHVLKATSNLQSVLGLNVSEAEFYALTHGAAHGLGMQSYFLDIGIEL